MAKALNPKIAQAAYAAGMWPYTAIGILRECKQAVQHMCYVATPNGRCTTSVLTGR